jgi:hypothetical protein
MLDLGEQVEHQVPSVRGLADLVVDPAGKTQRMYIADLVVRGDPRTNGSMRVDAGR